MQVIALVATLCSTSSWTALCSHSYEDSNPVVGGQKARCEHVGGGAVPGGGGWPGGGPGQAKAGT